MYSLFTIGRALRSGEENEQILIGLWQGRPMDAQTPCRMHAHRVLRTAFDGSGVAYRRAFCWVFCRVRLLLEPDEPYEQGIL